MTCSARFIKKPVAVEAMQHANREDVSPVIDWILSEGGTARWHEDANSIEFDTLHGPVTAAVGDWIVKGQGGDFWPNTAEEFARNYETEREYAERIG